MKRGIRYWSSPSPFCGRSSSSSTGSASMHSSHNTTENKQHAKEDVVHDRNCHSPTGMEKTAKGGDGGNRKGHADIDKSADNAGAKAAQAATATTSFFNLTQSCQSFLSLTTMTLLDSTMQLMQLTPSSVDLLPVSLSSSVRLPLLTYLACSLLWL